MHLQFNVFDIRDDLERGKFCIKKFSQYLFSRGYKVNEEYGVCSRFYEQDFMEQVDRLSYQKKNGEIVGKLFGVPFSVSENLLSIDSSYGYSDLLDVTILRRLFAEGALLLCSTKDSPWTRDDLILYSNELEQEIIDTSELCQASLAVRYGLTPVSLTLNSNYEWIFQTLHGGVFSFVPSRSLIPYTGLSLERELATRLVFFARNLKDMCIFCEVCSGDDGRDENLSRSLTKKLLVGRNFLDIFKPRVLVIDEKLNSGESEDNNSGWILNRITNNDFYSDRLDLSEFFDLDELVLQCENELVGQKKDLQKAGTVSNRRGGGVFFETFFSDLLSTSDVIILKLDISSAINDIFEYKLTKLFYFFGFPIIGVPFRFTDQEAVKLMLFFVGHKDRDDKLMSVVDYSMRNLLLFKGDY